MKSIIFYFSGTGNSLAVARDIVCRIEGSELVSIVEAIKEDNIDLSSYERIGFVIPIYYSRVPAIVKRFIKKLNFNKSQYIFGVMTFGGHYGNIFSDIKNDLEAQGGILGAGFLVFMPGNYIVSYNAYSKVIQKGSFRLKNKRVNYISNAVKEKKALIETKWSWFAGPSGILGIAKKSPETVNKIIAGFGEKAKNFYVTNKCVGCATCERICPVENIKIEYKQPKWGTQCEQCMACIQWCPMQAVQYGDKTEKRNRYHNPEIKISDMIINTKGVKR